MQKVSDGATITNNNPLILAATYTYIHACDGPNGNTQITMKSSQPCVMYSAADFIILQFQDVSREFVLLSLGPGFSASYPSSVETIMSLTTPTTNTIVCMLSPGDDVTDKGGQLAVVKCCLSYNNSYRYSLEGHSTCPENSSN